MKRFWFVEKIMSEVQHRTSADFAYIAVKMASILKHH